MSGPDPAAREFDARLRRAFAGIDTGIGFEARLAARVAALRTEPTEVLRERIVQGRIRAARRLRREAWLNAASAAGVGAAALALVWRQGPAVAAWLEGVLAASVDPGLLGGIAIAVLAAGLWPVLRGLLPR